jgi:hypothetical protein
MRSLQTLGLAVVATILSAGQVMADELAGQWTTNINGQQVAMTLRSDGSADFMGTPGRWQAANGQIVVASAQGQLQGAVQNGQLVFVYNGQQFVWTRAGGGPAAPQPGPAPAAAPAPAPEKGAPFKPAKVLPGRKVTPEHSQMSFTMPKDWTGAWTQMGNMPVYAIQVPGMQAKAMLGATAKVLGNERGLPMPTLLSQGARLVWGQAAAGAPLLTETFTVNGRAAGRSIYRATIPHPSTGQMVEAEGYLGLVVIDDFAFGVIGLYEAAQADNLRPGLDTMLASLSGTPPPRNRQMEGQIAGCWEAGTGTGPSTSKKGSAFTSAYLRIAPDGTYSRKGGVSVSTANDAAYGGGVSSEHGERGTFMIHGAMITWLPAGGGSYSNGIGFKPGGLYLDGKLWINCI